MAVRKWPGPGPYRPTRFAGPDASKAYPQVTGIAFNPSAPVPEALGGLSRIETIYQLPLPVFDPSILNFSFPAAVAEGPFSFVFKWFTSMSAWNCWVTMPDGTVRPAGCIPLVLNWMAWRDFSLVIISNLAALGMADLSESALLLVKWHP